MWLPPPLLPRAITFSSFYNFEEGLFTKEECIPCIPVGCVPSAAVAWGCLPGGVYLEGMSTEGGFAREGVCLRGCLPRGVCMGGVFAQGYLPSWCLTRGCTPPVNRITYRCKNITILQLLLRTVMMGILEQISEIQEYGVESLAALWQFFIQIFMIS